MHSKNFIQVFEYHKLKYDEHPDFKKNHFDAMVHFNEKNQNKYFTIVHKGVLFNSYVGVIQIGGLTIEILPKADKSISPNKRTWQSILLNMLRTCKKMNIDNISETNLKKRYNSILEVYFEIYLTEVEKLLKQGVIKKYRRVKENQFALKGKLLFAQNLKHNLTHKERFYCEHQIYDKDHLLHQILYCGLYIVKNLVNGLQKDRVYRLLQEFEFCSKIKVTNDHFDKLIIGRKEAPYVQAVDISKMIILNYSPSINAGKDNMLTLLFDMNVLWEEYIYRIVSKHKPQGHTVSFQNKQKFWEHKLIKPDIVYTGDETFVIDTKWKIIDNRHPSDNDLKQMFTYNIHWNAKKSILLYPKINQEDSHFGNYWYNNNKCKLGFVDLINGNNLKSNAQIAAEIFEKL